MRQMAIYPSGQRRRTEWLVRSVELDHPRRARWRFGHTHSSLGLTPSNSARANIMVSFHKAHLVFPIGEAIYNMRLTWPNTVTILQCRVLSLSCGLILWSELVSHSLALAVHALKWHSFRVMRQKTHVFGYGRHERHGEDVWLVDDRWIDREVKSPNMFSKRASPLPAFLTTGSS